MSYELDPETLTAAQQKLHNGFGLRKVITEAIAEEIAKGRLLIGGQPMKLEPLGPVKLGITPEVAAELAKPKTIEITDWKRVEIGLGKEKADELSSIEAETRKVVDEINKAASEGTFHHFTVDEPYDEGNFQEGESHPDDAE